MVNLQNRSNQAEMLDADDLSFADIQLCMKELNTINTLLGGHKITVDGINHFEAKKTALHVCEIGCGGGDNLNAIFKKHPKTTFTGIDLKTTCIEFAATQYPQLHAQWIASDYSKAAFKNTQPDVIFSSLFCHHFTNAQLIIMLQWMQQNSTKGFFINDLQRNTIAYYLIKWLTSIFSKSAMVKNDAPLSVARSFTKKDWVLLLEKAGIKDYFIRWKWAFRYLIICKK